MKKIYTALLLSALSATSFAEEVTLSNFYISASIGQAEHDVTRSNIRIGDEVDSFENKDTSFKLIGGYKLSDFMSFELGYVNLGNITSRQSEILTGNNFFDSANYSTSTKVDGFVIDGVLSYPITDSFSVYSKAGALAWAADYSLLTEIYSDTGDKLKLRETQFKSKADGTDFFYGVGASYRWLNISFNLEYEVFKTDKDIDALSIGLTYHFK